MSQADQPKKILVIRNDKIGDFMLAWPAFALLKSQYPQAKITALVPNYTAPLAEQCEWIDSVLIDEKKSLFFEDVQNLSKNIQQNNFDLSISLFSETRTSVALWLAGVKLRIGPATKIAQVFLNNRLRQKRSESSKPEYEYNLDLIKHYIRQNGDTLHTEPEPPFLNFGKNEIKQLRDQLKEKHAITEEQKVIIIHPGTGGSAINLSSKQYAELVRLLSKKSDTYFVITAGPGELSHAQELSRQLENIKHHIHESTTGIINFCKFINSGDIFIGGSTGPLHIAGALDVCTVAFYPTKRSASPIRWQTLNTPEHHLALTDTSDPASTEFKIDISASAEKIYQTFLG